MIINSLLATESKRFDSNLRSNGDPENPADLGSQSGSVDMSKLWWKGPPWLTDREKWPANIVTSPTAEVQAKSKVIRELFARAMATEDEFDILLDKSSLWRTL